ncbi:hypothetical protein CFB52_000030 [Burkholderia sp. AU18528]|uniref:AAA family ATPase n=1 Tax=Burkholderia TaxID=32008 RepID=UPI000C087A34|nr:MULTISPECIES: DUF3696 domain-containing protein [Burkholderia]MDF3113104.1 DUF3696 domain-containing protein [Burkholderia semiarida]PHP91268.1 hypothetical protein CFB52_000030 [Burkholderia sp. AU18528]
MLEQIKIKGFKTFSERTLIDLKDISILAGTNSAGKSTVIQVLTAFKQSIEEPASVGSLELNGPYVRLGGFKDTVSRGAESPTFQLGFCAKSHAGQAHIDYSFHEQSGRPVVSEIRYANESGEVCYGARNIPAGVTVVLAKLGLQHALASEKRPDVWVAMAGPIPLWEISFESSDSNTSRQEHLRETANGRIIEITKALLERTPASGVYARAAIEGIERGIVDRSLDEISTSLDSLLVASDLPRQRTLTEELINEIGSHIVVESLTASQISTLERLFLFSETELDVVATCELLAEEAAALPEGGYSVRQGADGKSISNFIAEIFSKLLYLGPLRRPPMLSYADKSETLCKILPDGTGLMAHLKSSWNDSTEFSPPFGTKEHLTVGICVNLWSRYLGICEGVEISGEPGFDYEIKFAPLRHFDEKGGEQVLDLPTNVGVGVTQLLPIIGLLIIAQKDSTCLFEQPELHLHPSAQTKLAELFVAAVKSNRQLIIETHSEHLINGIRIAVANQLIDPKQIEMMFVSPGQSGSSIRKVEMDKRGLIEDWPNGFFDESEKGAVKLLSAALKAGQKQ